jgi:hypothetical protein
MPFLWQTLLGKWLKLDYAALSKQWKEDLVRGWNILEWGGASMADLSFREVELLRLRYRLEKVNERLFQAYQTLGKKVMDYWAEAHPSLTEEERKREFRRIDLLLEEQKKILDQIRELQEAYLSRKEVISGADDKNRWQP